MNSVSSTLNQKQVDNQKRVEIAKFRLDGLTLPLHVDKADAARLRTVAPLLDMDYFGLSSSPYDRMAVRGELQTKLREIDADITRLQKEHSALASKRGSIITSVQKSVRAHVDIEWEQSEMQKEWRQTIAKIKPLAALLDALPTPALELISMCFDNNEVLTARQFIDKNIKISLEVDGMFLKMADAYLQVLKPISCMRENLEQKGSYIDWIWVEGDLSGKKPLQWFEYSAKSDGSHVLLEDVYSIFFSKDPASVMSAGRMAEMSETFSWEKIRQEFESAHGEDRLAYVQLRVAAARVEQTFNTHIDAIEKKIIDCFSGRPRDSNASQEEIGLLLKDARTELGEMRKIFSRRIREHVALLDGMGTLLHYYNGVMAEVSIDWSAAPAERAKEFSRFVSDYARENFYALHLECSSGLHSVFAKLEKEGAYHVFRDAKRSSVRYELRNVNGRLHLSQIAAKQTVPMQGYLKSLEFEFSSMAKIAPVQAEMEQKEREALQAQARRLLIQAALQSLQVQMQIEMESLPAQS